jgi:hypothetical protein
VLEQIGPWWSIEIIFLDIPNKVVVCPGVIIEQIDEYEVIRQEAARDEGVIEVVNWHHVVIEA